ncbi:MAG: TonB-dependent receptor [Bacteroidaceae bacterium]|nr:TonB-dependent receptor [Bacteroidaceae bacterium]
MKKKLMVLMTCLFVGIGLVNAQTSRVRGNVTSDEDGLPVIGATILVEGTDQGTITDMDGNFVLENVPSSAKNLVVSFIGMESQTVAIKSTVNVVLKADAEVLDEVMIVAYGTAKKSSFTGSAQTLKTEEIEKRAVSNVTKALDGLATGIQATTGSGQPGSSSTIYIRGLGSINAANTPLYVVDGMPYDGSISAINPDDIEAITVLKDASAAALYGARGANGVIMITTKKGQKGKSEVSFKAISGFSSRALPRYETMDSKEFVEALYSAYYNEYGSDAIYEMTEGASRVFGNNEEYNPFNYPIAELIDTETGLVRSDAKALWNEDWLGAITRDNAMRNEYVLSFNGGDDKTQYMFSLGYVNEDGILETTNFQRYTGRTNIETSPVEWFKAGLGINFSHSKSNAAQTDANATSNVWYSAQLMAPIYPIYYRDRNNNGAYILDENGDKIFDYGDTRPSGQQQNFNSIATLYDDKYSSEANNLSGRTHIDLGGLKSGWSKGLTLTANFGFDYYNANSLQYYNPFFGNAESVHGRITTQNSSSLGLTFNQLLTYNRSIGNHNIDALVGHEWYSYEERYLLGGKTGVPFGGLYELDAATTMTDVGGSSAQYRIESYMGRLNYDYNEKYYLSASLRKDGSSRFHKDSRWGNFWSVGGNYKISSERFMKGIEWLSNLSVRASYGVQGNDNLGSFFAWQSLYNLGYPAANNSGALLGSISSQDITWESSENINVGLDAGLFEQRVQIGLEWYKRVTTDMLLYYPLPLSTGFGGYNRNSGDMMNTGVEATISGYIVNNKNFKWNMTVMGSTMRNEVLKLTDDGKDIISGSQIIREGEALYSYYLCRSAGVDPFNGDQLYWATVDSKGNEVDAYITNNQTLAQASRVIAGSKYADLFGSINSQMQYKQFDLSIATNYSIGGEMLDGVYNGMMNFYYAGQTKHKNLSRAWKKVGDVTDIHRYIIGDSSPSTDAMLIDASYFSLKNITFGYTLPKKMTNNIGLNELRLAVSADNLHTFTHLKGMDPQYSMTGGTTYVYAPARTISFRLDVKF